MTSQFHEAAAWIFELLAETPLARESRDEAIENARTIDEVAKIFRDTLNQH